MYMYMYSTCTLYVYSGGPCLIFDPLENFYGPTSTLVFCLQNLFDRYGSDKPLVYRNIDFGIDLETRVALVGPNGAGKSTLLKMIDGEVRDAKGAEERGRERERVGEGVGGWERVREGGRVGGREGGEEVCWQSVMFLLCMYYLTHRHGETDY